MSGGGRFDVKLENCWRYTLGRLAWLAAVSITWEELGLETDIFVSNSTVYSNQVRYLNLLYNCELVLPRLSSPSLNQLTWKRYICFVLKHIA